MTTELYVVWGVQVCAQGGAHSPHGSAGAGGAVPAALREGVCGQAAGARRAGPAGQPHAAHLPLAQPPGWAACTGPRSPHLCTLGAVTPCMLFLI